jgi:hypothetical protein
LKLVENSRLFLRNGIHSKALAAPERNDPACPDDPELEALK